MSDLLRATIRKLLVTERERLGAGDAPAFSWTFQGLGMLRLNLDDGDARVSHRLHLWDQSAAIVGVSDIHNHPWDLESLVLWGSIIDTRWYDAAAVEGVGAETIVAGRSALIRCGTDACQLDRNVRDVWLKPDRRTIREGETYWLDHRTLHSTVAPVPTVTLTKRTRLEHLDPDHAQVAWLGGGDWVDAEPWDAAGEREMILRFLDAVIAAHHLATSEFAGEAL